MAELYYADNILTIEDNSNKDQIFLKFDTKESFVEFFNNLNPEDFKTYTIKKNTGETIEGHALAIRGVMVLFDGNGQLSVRMNIIQKSENQILKDTIETLAESAMTNTDDWNEGTKYQAGDMLTYNDSLYKVVKSHTAKGNSSPDDKPSFFTRVYTPKKAKVKKNA